jgi:hypothetical protein
MDVAFISELRDGRRVFRYVDAARENASVQIGASDPIEDTYCQRVIDGRLPEVILDAAEVSAASALPFTRGSAGRVASVRADPALRRQGVRHAGLHQLCARLVPRLRGI